MPLSFLIPSKIRRRVIEYFILNEDVEVYIRELASELGEAPQLVHRELKNMEEWGFLVSHKRGNLRLFKINSNFNLLEPLEGLFVKQKYSDIKSAVKKRVVKTFKMTELLKQPTKNK